MTRTTIVAAALVLVTALAGCGDKKAAPNTEHADAEQHSEGEAQADGDEHAEGEADGHAEEAPSTKIPTQRAASVGIRTEHAGQGVIADQHEVQGLLTPVEGSIAKVQARFPGPIRSLRANVGDTVRAGQPLATIESNLSLTTYTVPAPISGVVLARDASVGAVANEGMALYEIANLGDLWVDLHIFGRDAQHIRPGNGVVITRMSDGESAETRIERILPSTATASQSTVARARIKNSDGMWRPGSAVRARITVDEQPTAIAIPLTALQTDGEQDVVYVLKGETYTQRPVRLGKRDATRVEVLAGLKPGESVVTQQSFLIKADIEKSTAEHDH
ncbi:efflux RND transporter periplasmic adaptor subunit [Thermomonas sp. LB-4]|uniref:efflux RND transporter periplasmic adaptor subunit n=1 Tax=Thermomonas sp. LB-4 TaxID=3102790 RepID=UPI002EDBB65B